MRMARIGMLGGREKRAALALSTVNILELPVLLFVLNALSAHLTNTHTHIHTHPHTT